MIFILIENTWKLSNKVVSNNEMGKNFSLPFCVFCLFVYSHITTTFTLVIPDVWGFDSLISQVKGSVP